MEDYWSPGTGGDPLIPRAETSAALDVAARHGVVELRGSSWRQEGDKKDGTGTMYIYRYMYWSIGA